MGRAVMRELEVESAVGYSCAGRVVEVGARVAGLQPGDPVACGGAGHANHAEIVGVPRNLVTRIPTGVPMEAAALTTIAAVALHGVRLGGVEVGHRAAVIGCGLVGQLACGVDRPQVFPAVGLDDHARLRRRRRVVLPEEELFAVAFEGDLDQVAQ